jgi:hypothetical protein
MVTKITETLVDDLDGVTDADQTLEFHLDGVNYEIDLSAKNAKKLRADFQKWVDTGRRIGGRRRGSSASYRRGASQVDRNESAAIRRWAHEHGHQVAARGRIPADVVDEYRGATKR